MGKNGRKNGIGWTRERRYTVSLAGSTGLKYRWLNSYSRKEQEKTEQIRRALVTRTAATRPAMSFLGFFALNYLVGLFNFFFLRGRGLCTISGIA